MCVNCNISSTESVSTDSSQNLVVSPDADQITIDYPLSWVSFLSVTDRAEPYGMPLFDSAGRNVSDVVNILIPGIYVGQARIGLDSYGSTDCSLHIPSDGSAPFIRVYTKSPNFYR